MELRTTVVVVEVVPVVLEKLDHRLEVDTVD